MSKQFRRHAEARSIFTGSGNKQHQAKFLLPLWRNQVDVPAPFKQIIIVIENDFKVEGYQINKKCKI